MEKSTFTLLILHEFHHAGLNTCISSGEVIFLLSLVSYMNEELQWTSFSGQQSKGAQFT